MEKRWFFNCYSMFRLCRSNSIKSVLCKVFKGKGICALFGCSFLQRIYGRTDYDGGFLFYFSNSFSFKNIYYNIWKLQSVYLKFQL